MNHKIIFSLDILCVLVVSFGTVWMATKLPSREYYRQYIKDSATIHNLQLQHFNDSCRIELLQGRDSLLSEQLKTQLP